MYNITFTFNGVLFRSRPDDFYYFLTQINKYSLRIYSTIIHELYHILNIIIFFLRLLKMTIHDQLDTAMCLSCFWDSFEDISLQKII